MERRQKNFSQMTMDPEFEFEEIKETEAERLQRLDAEGYFAR